MIVKFTALAVITAVFSVLLKNYNKEYAIILVLVTSVVFFGYIFSSLNTIFTYIDGVCNSYGIDKDTMKILLKSLGIAYVSEFASALCRDFNESAISLKIELVGKITITLMALPLLKEFINKLIFLF